MPINKYEVHRFGIQEYFKTRKLLLMDPRYGRLLLLLLLWANR